jgi:hypothetical protein
LADAQAELAVIETKFNQLNKQKKLLKDRGTPCKRTHMYFISKCAICFALMSILVGIKITKIEKRINESVAAAQ